MSDERALAAELALERAGRRVLARVQALEAQLETADHESWAAYLEAVETLVVLARDRQVPGRLLSTKELAARLGVSTKTVQRHRKGGTLTPALARGRVIRWAADSVPRGTATGTTSSDAAHSALGSSLPRAVRREQQR